APSSVDGSLRSGWQKAENFWPNRVLEKRQPLRRTNPNRHIHQRPRTLLACHLHRTSRHGANWLREASETLAAFTARHAAPSVIAGRAFFVGAVSATIARGPNLPPARQ